MTFTHVFAGQMKIPFFRFASFYIRFMTKVSFTYFITSRYTHEIQYKSNRGRKSPLKLPHSMYGMYK